MAFSEFAQFDNKKNHRALIGQAMLRPRKGAPITPGARGRALLGLPFRSLLRPLHQAASQ